VPVYLDIAARNIRNTYEKGDVVGVGVDHFSDDPTGALVGVCITDIHDNKQVEKYAKRWKLILDFTIDAENDEGWRVVVSANPACISASGVGRDEIKQHMVDFIGNDPAFSRTGVRIPAGGFTPSSLTLLIPKGGPVQTARGLSDQEQAG